ncbi:hypothetical protein BD311DRAFT_675624, partial [Dichomitus squalens]
FWGRKVAGATILFWLNKYMTTLCLVWDLASGLNISDELEALFQNSVFLAFTGIRVYALQRSLPLCLMTIALSLVPVGVNFVRSYQATFTCNVSTDALSGRLFFLD